MERAFELIVAIVNRGFSDLVMDAARKAGASGGTILHGRGTGVHEAAQFFGVAIQPEKELVLTGRDPDARLLKKADYVTRFQKEKHPYDQGSLARKGIEF